MSLCDRHTEQPEAKQTSGIISLDNPARIVTALLQRVNLGLDREHMAPNRSDNPLTGILAL
jgi:hypothetical protein